jgi:hypothetical protein
LGVSSETRPQDTEEPLGALQGLAGLPRVICGEIVANLRHSNRKTGYCMQPIDTAFDEGRFRYTQLERHGDIAIYEQQHKENPQVVRYEVIRIRVQPEHTWSSGQTTPEREAYPGASVWGRLGFTCFALEEARALAAGLQAQGVTSEHGDGDAGDPAPLPPLAGGQGLDQATCSSYSAKEIPGSPGT